MMARVTVLVVFILLNYYSVSSLVTDYKIVTWNSQGYKLERVFHLFDARPDLDIIFVQESGAITNHNPGIVITTGLPEFVIVDPLYQYTCDPAGLLQVRRIQLRNVRLYIYHFPAPPEVNSQLSLTIVSRHVASEILYLTSQHNHRDCQHVRSFINRPVAGLVIRNNNVDNVFFNIHAENVNHPRNEVSNQLETIRNYMHRERPTASWLLVGDFNREPDSVRSNLTAQEHLVSPPNPTHSNRVLDYLIYGSPDQNVFAQMNAVRYQASNQDNWLRSDHGAVYFEIF